MARKNKRFQSNTQAAKTEQQEQGRAAPAVQNSSPTEVYVCSHLHKGVIFDMPDGKKVRIAGINDRLRGASKGIIATGGGIYTKVDAASWDYIIKTFADYQAIKNGLMYAETSAGRAKAAIRERDELRDGFEPVDPKAAKTQAADAKEI